jgi:glycosyltransferase involved in cell wall biosynthesis
VELERRGFEHIAQLARGVDGRLFQPGRRDDALRRQWGLAEQDIAVLHVGRLAAEENLALLGAPSASCAWRTRSSSCAWSSSATGRSAQLAHELPEAIFCGLQRGEELARHYASGDLFLFPSLSETFGNVVLEALASGLAVVAFDQAAAAQHIRHGYNGALATPGDEADFIDAASWLLDDREHLRHLRLNAPACRAPGMGQHRRTFRGLPAGRQPLAGVQRDRQ